jgi:hypothetical protein
MILSLNGKKENGIDLIHITAKFSASSLNRHLGTASESANRSRREEQQHISHPPAATPPRPNTFAQEQPTNIAAINVRPS